MSGVSEQGKGHRGGKLATGARDDVIGALAEAEGVFGVETMAGGKASDGGAQGAVTRVDGRQHGGWEGVAVRRGAGNMGRVGGGGVVS